MVRDRYAGQLAALLRLGGRRAREEIYRFKANTHPSLVASVFPRVFRDARALDVFHGAAFPKSFAELYSAPAMQGPASIVHEVVWGLCRTLLHAEQLRTFVQLKADFEHAFVAGAYKECSELIKRAKSEFGCSMWLAQNELSLSHALHGLEEARKLSKAYQEEAGDAWISKTLLWFIGRKVEGTDVKDYLRSELDRIFGGAEGIDALKTYIWAKLFELHNISNDAVPAVLFFEAQCGVIDHFETLVQVLQAAAANRAIPADVVDVLAEPMLALRRAVQDVRLDGILRALGVHVPFQAVDPVRAEIIEAYSRGDYQGVALSAKKYLANAPGDFPLLVLYLRACTHSGTAVEHSSGPLGEIAASLAHVLNATPQAYQAAYSVFTLADRYSTQSWTHYVRAVVLYELRREDWTYPPPALRGVYVRDRHVTPFSAFAFRGQARQAVENDGALRTAFPLTMAVYRAAAYGENSGGLSLCEPRFKFYLARFHLSRGQFSEAKDLYAQVLKATTGSDRLRSAGGAALACMGMNDLQGAADMVIGAFTRNQSMPTLLPIEDVIGRASQPASWPNALSVPILFELFSTYCDASGLAATRYAFERFQLANHISDPADVKRLTPSVGREAVICYLDRVWRPEIMRQTLLYSSAREIEETRIKVCRLLNEIDPVNSAKYLDEIKERVKQQEILKGTTLIEQSKVYVDIDAIRKALKSKVGDAYARYRASAHSYDVKTDAMLYVITQAAAQVGQSKGRSLQSVLAQVHLIDLPEETEADAQFAALFAQITNEFLKGAHGLNAYLSTCVRHGTLSNTLRKPVADERLVTTRDDATKTYRRNDHWLQKHDLTWRKDWLVISEALEMFSQEFDSVIDHVRDKLLQIRVIHGLSDEGENTDALFIYRTSNVERKIVQAFASQSADLNDVINYSIDALWEKTDDNLKAVREVLSTDIRHRFRAAFDKLEQKLNEHVGVPGISDLQNAVAHAWTNTQTQLATVISWFKRSEVYDRQDYNPDFAAQIALHMIYSTISDAARWPGPSIDVDSDGSLMPGRTLDALVYMFYDLFANAILRSGIEAQELVVPVSITFKAGRYSARLSNKVAPNVLTPAEREMVLRLSSALAKSDAFGRAQTERNSGLHKIWTALNAPIYRSPFLKVGHQNDSFIIELGFELEGS